MLIKVFGEWINPSSIAKLQPTYKTTDNGKTNYSDSCTALHIGGEDCHYTHFDKCADEVAAEINRQIKQEGEG